jgi:hypothetical protein
MLNKSLRILNFDDSILKQENLLSRYEKDILDFKDLSSQARCWVNIKTRGIIEKRIYGSAKNSITFLGSGDFHHISEILISQFHEPMCVIVFDFHPDWAILPPRFGCGAWVSQILKKKNISKIILVGVSSQDISSFDIQAGNLDSLKSDRVEIYPYAHQPSLTFLKKIPQNISLGIKNGVFFNKVYWQELKDKNLREFFLSLLKRLPTRNAYISIDKDCLRKDFALTNWEEGRLTLEELLLMLKLIKENLNIIGLDIVGDHSRICLEGAIKKIASHLDHPKAFSAKDQPESYITSVNEDTNLKILQLLNS